MKKIFCILLFCMMFLSVHNIFAQEKTDLLYEEAAIVFNAINKPFNTGDQLVTRAAFTERLISVISFSQPEAKEYFNDISTDAEYAGAITAAYDMGIVNSIEFRPDDIITVTEAATMLVRALGYEVYAVNEGGYPGGYMNRAHTIGLMKGVSSSGQVTECMASVMLFNFLKADIVEITSDGNIVVAKDKNILNSDYDIESDKGILRADGITSIYRGGQTVPAGYVIIGNEMYKSSSDLSEYIGHNLKYYYVNDEDEKEIVGVIPYKNNKITISTDDVISVNDGKLCYEVDKSRKNDVIKISTSMDLIYNGILKEKYTNDVFLNAYGSLVFIDNNDDGEYDVGVITSYRNIVAGAIDEEEYVIYDKFGKDKVELEADKYDKIEIIKNNEHISFSEINVGDVLSIEDNAGDDKLIRVYVVSDVLFGSVNAKHDDKKLVINASEFKTSIFDEISVNDYGYFYFDILGKICAFEKEHKKQYAYLLFVWQEESDECVNVRVFEESGEVKKLLLSDKVNIDGVRYSEYNKAYHVIKEAENSLIRINVNDKGKIYNIDTEKINAEISENDFTKAFPGQANKNYKSGSGIFGGVCGIDANTVIFSIPKDVRDYDGYSIKTISYFNNDDKYSFDGYDPNEVNILAAMVVNAVENNSINDKSPIGIISKISRGVTDDDDVLYKIDLITNGLQTAYFIKNDELAKLLEVGDVIRYSLDSHSQIEEIKTVYKHNGKVLNNPEISDVSPIYGNFDSKYRVALGTVRRKIDDYMTVEIDGSVETMKIASKTHIYIVGNSSGRSGGNNIRVGKSDDIFDSLSKPSKVLVRTRYGDLSEVIIFKEEE